MKPLDLIELQALSWEEFEDLCRCLLELEGYIGVTAAGRNRFGFDLFATEVRPTRHGMPDIVRWGVQCKKWKKGVGPSVLLKMAAAAGVEQDVGGVFLLTAGTLTGEATRILEANRKKANRSIEFAAWDGLTIKRRLLRHPKLINLYFDFVPNQLQALRLADEGQTEELVAGLLRILGIPGLRQLVEGTPVSEKVSQARVDGIHALLESESERASVPAEVAALSHRTILLPLDARTCAGTEPSPLLSSQYYRIIDRVRLTYIDQPPQEFVFKFTPDKHAFDQSLNTEQSEYSWLLPRDTDVPLVSPLIDVPHFRINGRLVEKRACRIGLSMRAISFVCPKSLRGLRNACIEYEVMNIFSKSETSLFSVLHRPTNGFDFQFEYGATEIESAEVIPFLPTCAQALRIMENPDDVEGVLRVSCSGLAATGEGLMIKW